MKYANKIMPDIIAELDASVQDCVGKYVDMREFNREVWQKIKTISEACGFQFNNTHLVYNFEFRSLTPVIRCVIDLKEDKRFKYRRKGRINNIYFCIERRANMQYPRDINLDRYLKLLDIYMTGKLMEVQQGEAEKKELEVKRIKKYLQDMADHCNTVADSLNKPNTTMINKEVTAKVFHKIKKGTLLEFTAHRITIGNPVTGKYISNDDNSFIVELTKRIDGLSTYWLPGYEKSFPFDLVSNLKIRNSKSVK